MAYSWNREVDTTNTVATCDEVQVGEADQGLVFVPTGLSTTSLDFYVAPEDGDTYLPLYNGATAVSLTVVAGRAYQLPTQLWGARAFKMVTNHTSGETVEVSLQSRGRN